MEPYILNAYQKRRQDLIDQRLNERLCAICIPKLLPLLGGNDVPQARSMVQAQLNRLRSQEIHLLSGKTSFIAQVITERCTQIINAQQRRTQEATLLARDHLFASKPSEAELLRRSMKSEIISRFSKLQQALLLEDRRQTGELSPNTIRLLCRQFNLESGTLDNALADCYSNSQRQSGAMLQYGPLVEKLIQTDYSDLFKDDDSSTPTQDEWGGAYQNPNSPTNNGLTLGRSSLRRRSDGVAGSVRIRQVPVDEWSVISKNNNTIANLYEKDMDEQKLKETYRYGQDLKNFAISKKEQEKQNNYAQKLKEREQENYKLMQYQLEQQNLQEKQAQLELEAWQEGQTTIRSKKEKQEALKRQEILEAQARVRKNNEEAEQEYLAAMQKVADKKQEWRDSLQHNIKQMKIKQEEEQIEKIKDQKRQEEYAKMLEKDHLARMAALEKSLNYRPPEASIRAAKGITAKALEDEQRAFRVQRLREAESNERDTNNQLMRQQRDLNTFQFLQQQAAEKIVREKQLKEEDARMQQNLLVQVQDAIKQEQINQQQKRDKAKLLAMAQRRQAQQRDAEKTLRNGMSPRERAYNRDMFETLASRSTAGNSPLSNSGRRLFG